MPNTPHALSEEESKRLARHIVQELIRQLDNEETIGAVAQKWGAHLDRWLGKNFRRLLVLIFMGISGALAVKFEVWTHWLNK